MAVLSPTSPFDQLGLDTPFAERTGEADRYESEPAWNELGESPYAEASATERSRQQEPERLLADPDSERLAWLDVEAADGSGEDEGSDGQSPYAEADREHEHEHEHLHEDEEEAAAHGTVLQAEYLDDEERDASESRQAPTLEDSLQEGFAAEAGSAQPLSGQQRAWILALDRSAIERLPDAAMRTSFLQQDWSDVEFPGNVPKGQATTDKIKRHWTLARSLFNAMAGVTPERRVPTTIRFRDRPAVKVPGQPSQRLFAEARDAFLRMHAAAKADGVDLVILSSWRSRARQAAASASQPNPAAVARKASAHMYGLAIDLRMGVPGLPVKEINTRVDPAAAAKAGTAAKMGNIVRMYRSPVYKWMALRAREFGWYPYRNEPWHWEYNPPGLKARFESATRGELEQEAQGSGAAASWERADEESPYARTEQEEHQQQDQHEQRAEEYEGEGAAPSAFLRTFTAKALGVRVAVYVTQAAHRAKQVEMMVFAHGLDLCKPVIKNRPATFITERPFKLGELVEASGRPIVLAVPFLDWEHIDANRMAFGRKWHRLAQPANFNQVAAEALEQARAITGSAAPPTLQRLILAGHSRAYGFFDALAHEHASPAMRTGALSCPIHIWALDTTYSAPIADWRAWLRSREDLQATVVFRHGKYQTKGSTILRELGTGIRGREFMQLTTASNGRLTVLPVAAGKVSHCGIPTAYLPRLLATLPALASAGENETQVRYDEFQQGEDEAGLANQAEDLSSEEEVISGEGTEQPATEEELDIPDRFDAFGDERDFEWDAESSEEEQIQEGSLGEAESNLSFALDQEDEAGLAGSGLTPAEQKAVEITSLFETGRRGGFYGLSGNFDGQGLSFGLVNWTIGTGSLQPLLRDFAKEHPARWVLVFGADASRFLQLMTRKDKDARKEQHRFAIEQMNSVSVGARGKRIWTVRQPWVGYFRRLSEDRAFQNIQVRYVRELLASAERYCRHFQLKSEQAFCFMFDTVASHGKWWVMKKFGGVEKRRLLIEQALKVLGARFGAGRVPESEVLLAIADVLATTSAQRWADKVRRRKRWFVTGQHPRGRELDGLRPRAEVAYSTSRSTARDSLSESAGSAGELENVLAHEVMQEQAEVPPGWRPDDLISPRFAGDRILSACFRDKARLREGATGPAVAKVQQALIDLGYGLGPAGADARYGAATAAAVRAFKRKERLGFEQYGDVGPGTMRRLDQIFAGEPHTGVHAENEVALMGESGERFVPILLAPPSALQVPPDEGDCPPGPVAFAPFDETTPESAETADPCLLAPAPAGAISDFERDLRKNPGRIMSVVIDPDNPDEIIGYRVRTDPTVLQIVDREGNFVCGNEKSLDTPMLDPIDFIPSPGGIAKGTVVIGKVGLKALGKLVAKEVPAKSLWKVSAAALPRLRGISAAMLRRATRAAVKEIPNVARRVTEEGLNHSFDRHAAQWFGGVVQRVTHFEAWRRLVQRGMLSSEVFPWSLGASKTIGHLALIDGKYFVVHFFAETGELASAFVPSQRQVGQILLLLAKMK